MTGILGREAVYSGQAVDVGQGDAVQARLGPPEYAIGAYPIPPVAMPGQYRFD